MNTFERIMNALGNTRLADFGNGITVAAYPARLVEEVLNSVLSKECACNTPQKTVQLCPKCNGEGYLLDGKNATSVSRICPTCTGARIFIV